MGDCDGLGLGKGLAWTALGGVHQLEEGLLFGLGEMSILLVSKVGIVIKRVSCRGSRVNVLEGRCRLFRLCLFPVSLLWLRLEVLQDLEALVY